MDFRLSREEDYPAIRRLWSQSFGEEEPWTSWYFSRHFRADQIWVGEENGTVVAQAHLLPYRLMLRGAWRDAVYFVGVCVEEELRGTGIGRELMGTALAELRRSAVGISILQPRWPIFYQKLGWDYAYSRQRYSISIDDAKKQLRACEILLTEWKPDEQEIEPVADLYGAFAKLRHGYALRTRRDWENLLADHRSEGGRVGILSRTGLPAGYVMYKVLGKTLHVREMAWLEPWVVDEAWRLAMGQAEQDNSIDSLEWEDPSGGSESVFYSGSLSVPFLMGRMTDVKTVLEAMEYPAELTAEWILQVTDPLAPWNQGTFRWCICEGKGVLCPRTSDEPASLRIDIGDLSQMFFGERSVREILSAGQRTSCSKEDQAILELIFPACSNYISEYY